MDSAATLGKRIQVVGPSCSGKSTLAEELARRLGSKFLELDALYWLPGWQEPPDGRFERLVAEQTSAESWVAAGNYTRRTIPLYWRNLDTVVWLDFPERVVYPRILARSWRRWRSNEHLWGTNYERFWSQLKIWDPKDSLIGYGLRNRARARGRFLEAMADPELQHVRWVRLTSRAQVQGWLAGIAPKDSLACPVTSRRPATITLASDHRGVTAVPANKPDPKPMIEDEGIFSSIRRRTETVDHNETITIHAEKNQDIEVENDETHAVGHDRPRGYRESDFDFASRVADDGPTTTTQFWGDDNGEIPFDHLKFQRISGDWNGDGQDTVGLAGDFNADGDVDGADLA